MKKFLLFLLMSSNAFAGSGYFKFGVGVDNNIGRTKLIATGYQSHLISVFDYQLEGGMFADNNQEQGIIYFGGASFGLSVYTPSGLYAKLFSGPSLISHTDTRLSSALEFNEDIELGLRDGRGITLGAVFKHMSNAGLVLPNRGRDFLIIKFQIPF